MTRRERTADQFDPQAYWERRYATGRTSGAGSEGEAAEAKADYINALIGEHGIKSVVDWGCGDGEVLHRITRDVAYTGIDVSLTAISRVATRYPDRRFLTLDDVVKNFDLDVLEADMAMSLDVLFHLPDDRDFVAHLQQVFGSARRLVLVHATDHDGGRTARHVRWRRWTPSIPRGWRVVEKPADPTVEAFYVVERSGGVIPERERRERW